MNRPWFRMHAEAVDDEKLRLLAFEDRWHFVALLCLKAQGTLDSSAPRLEQRIALKLGLQLAQLDELKRRLTEIGLIDETFQPVSWGKRQYESDTSTERVRAHRAKVAADKQAAESKGETGMKRPGNVSVTPSEQNRTDTEQSREERARDDVPRGTRDAGNALTRTPNAEALLAEMNDSWKRDVEGVNVEVLQRFFDFVANEINPPSKRKHFSPTARISLAKRLAGMGNAAYQGVIVEQSISADHAVLYPLKDRPAKHGIDAAKTAEQARREKLDLSARALVVHFRGAHPGEDLADYRVLVERAERDAKEGEYRAGLAKKQSGPVSTAELLASVK